MNEVSLQNQGAIIESQVNKIIETLNLLGLPSDNIMAELDERQKIGTNLAGVIDKIPTELKRDARYLSKFVLGAGFGLFDYSLNAIWNEVVLSLRKKAVVYGLDIFFDNAVNGKLREAYQTEENLKGLKDSVLLHTCKKLELISETTYKKLVHILDMRNDIGISHPTSYSIHAFELLGWLETCVKDVLNDETSDNAIQVKSFIDNLKSSDVVIPEGTFKSISLQINTLPMAHVDNILRTIFGIYVTPSSTATLLKNISLFAPLVWNLASNDVKYKLGIILEGYKNNLHQEKYSSGEKFFEVCDGNSYKSLSQRIIILDELSNELLTKHRNWDNYYHEVPLIEKMMSHIQNTSDIPVEIVNTLIRNILICRIGKGIEYHDGVSPNAKYYYDLFFELLGDKYAPHFLLQLMDYEINNKLNNPIRKLHAKYVISLVKTKVTIPRLLEAFSYLEENIDKSIKVMFDSKFKELTKGFISYR